MQQAVSFYGAGEWVRAERLCRSVLNAQAGHFEALNLLGVIAARTGHAKEAADLLGRAVAAKPADATAHLNYGNVLRSFGQFPAALTCYENALKVQPQFPEAHFNRANVLKDLGRFAEALDGYERASVQRFSLCSVAPRLL